MNEDDTISSWFSDTSFVKESRRSSIRPGDNNYSLKESNRQIKDHIHFSSEKPNAMEDVRESNFLKEKRESDTLLPDPLATPRTPPTPPVKMLKSILRSSSKKKEVGSNRSVSFLRNFSILSFDKSQPVTSLTPNLPRKLDLENSAKVVRVPSLRQIQEESEEEIKNSSPKTSSRISFDEDKDYEQNDTQDNENLAPPGLRDFLEEIDSVDKRRLTMDVPTLLDFVQGDSYETELSAAAGDDVTQNIPTLMDFLQDPSITLSRTSSDQTRRKTLDVPMISEFMETSEFPLETHTERSVSRRTTLDAPLLKDFIDQHTITNLTTTDSIEEPSEEGVKTITRRETLDIPKIKEFIENDNHNEDDTFNVPYVQDFI